MLEGVTRLLGERLFGRVVRSFGDCCRESATAIPSSISPSLPFGDISAQRAVSRNGSANYGWTDRPDREARSHLATKTHSSLCGAARRWHGWSLVVPTMFRRSKKVPGYVLDVSRIWASARAHAGVAVGVDTALIGLYGERFDEAGFTRGNRLLGAAVLRPGICMGYQQRLW